MPSAASPPPPSPAVAELASIVLARQPLDQVLGRIAELAVADIPGVDQASVTLVREERPYTAAFTGEIAARLDERQYASGFGPCVDAALSGSTIEIADTAAATVYRDFARLADEIGVRHTISVGMPVATATLGALNLYGLGTDPGLRAVAEAQVFARFAAVALMNAVALTEAWRLAEQMRDAMATRSVIEQAKGILMRDHRCTSEEAMGMLIATADRTGGRLRDIATAMIQGVGSRE